MMLLDVILDVLFGLWGANDRMAETDPLAQSPVGRHTRLLQTELFAGAIIVILLLAGFIALVRMR
jgi:hypothetical protein